jgi:peptidoglycan/xylan/chitin deacetylase (PgdA/CDA1 family)
MARRVSKLRDVSDTLVLCYHALSERWPAALSTTPERFAQQLEALLRRGYEPQTFTAAVKGAGAKKALAVTFDDAYRSVIELARPIMDRLGVPGTVFAPTDWIGRDEPMQWDGIDQWLGGEHEQELLCMSQGQLDQLAGAGWEVGSHTCSHPHLTTLDDQALENELRASKEALGGAECRSIAYPYGDVDARVVAAARATGYETAASLPKRFGSRDPLDWPRVGVYHVDDLRRFKLKASRVTRLIRR